MGKVLVIGLDGATFDVIKPLIKKGALPNLKSLMKKGAYGVLKSTIMPITSVAWASFYTGKNPGKHGIFDFFWGRPYEPDHKIVNSEMIEGEKLWEVAGKFNKKTIAINLPFTYPPRKINGLLISGFGTPSTKSKFTYPSWLRKYLLEKFNYEIDPNPKEYLKKETLLKGERRVNKKRERATLHLMDKFNWDLFMVVFSSIDHIQHHFWGNSKVIEEFYRRADITIGRMLSKVDKNTTVVIMSDHGFGLAKKEFLINNWLKEVGLLELKKDRFKAIKNLFAKVGFSRENIQYLLTFLKLNRYIEKVPFRLRAQIPGKENYLWDINWKKTKAYAALYLGKIFINLKGREPYGIVKEEEYEEMRDFLIKKLLKLRDPESGRRIVRKVHKKEEIYHGPHLDKAPDLQIIPEDWTIIPSCNFRDGSIFYPSNLEGTHKLNGIIIISGERIKKGEIVDGEIIDIAPTVLTLLDVQIPEDMDGKILPCIRNTNRFF
jgi:predicted AlkP superfamily phosphohydrolase/phosphomutase